MFRNTLETMWTECQSSFTLESVLTILAVIIVFSAIAFILIKFEKELSGHRYNEVKKETKEKTFTRADIIHAFTSGHMLGREGMIHGKALEKYKKEQNL